MMCGAPWRRLRLLGRILLPSIPWPSRGRPGSTCSGEEYGGLKIQNTPEMIELSAACARQMGMEPYYLYRQKNMAGNFENVGYSLPGKACIYNIPYYGGDADHSGLRRRNHHQGGIPL